MERPRCRRWIKTTLKYNNLIKIIKMKRIILQEFGLTPKNLRKALNPKIYDTNLIDLVYQYVYQPKLEIAVATETIISKLDLAEFKTAVFYSDDKEVMLNNTKNLQPGELYMFCFSYMTPAHHYLSNHIYFGIFQNSDKKLNNTYIKFKVCIPGGRFVQLNENNVVIKILPPDILNILKRIYKI